jgi:hypothetical protein
VVVAAAGALHIACNAYVEKQIAADAALVKAAGIKMHQEVSDPIEPNPRSVCRRGMR